MRVVTILMSYVCLFAMSLTMCMWGHDFPIAYHADEAGKVMQVLGKLDRNHKHPPLLLDLSSVTHKLSGHRDGLPQVVAAGRLVSAIAGALSVVMLTAMSHWLAGKLSALLVGIMLAGCPSLIIFSHYMKEDALLLMGIAAVFLASTAFWQKSRWWTVMLLAIACVITILAKYIGVVMLLCAVVLFMCRLRSLEKRQRYTLSLSFILSMIAAFILLGYHWWANWDDAIKGLAYEWNHVRSGHIDLKLSLLGALRYYAWNIPWQMRYWSILPGILGIFWLMKASDKPVNIIARLAISLCLIYGTLLVIGRVAGDRYALPVVVLITWLAAMCLARLITTRKTRQLRQRLGVLVFMLVVGACGCQVYQVIYQFDHDGRPAMGQWVRANLNASHHLVEDLYCAMPDQRYPVQVELFGHWEPQIRMKRYAAAFGTLSELRAKGVTHVAVCNYSYDRFINTKGLEPTQVDPKAFARIQHCRTFYTQLFATGNVVWSHHPRYKLPGLTSPTLVIFQLQ